MRQLCACWRRVRGLFGRRPGEDLSAELESHLLMQIDDHVRSGMSPDEARRAALIQSGGIEQAKQAYRERESLPWLETLCQDLRFGWRMLRKSPGFAAVAVLMLALGIGANTAIFSFVDALFLKPLAVSKPEQLVRVYAKGPSGHYGAGFAYPEFTRLRDHNSSFAALSVETERPQLHLVTGGGSEEIRGEFVSGNYFDLLGIPLHLGRGFLPEEDSVPGRDAVAVISDALWKSRFHADPAILGHEIRINDISFKVVGVAPPGFYGDLTGLPAEVWVPAMMFGAAGYGCTDHSYNCSLFDGMIGRLAPGQTLARAQAELSSTILWSATDWPEKPSRREVVLTSTKGESPDDAAEDAAQMRLLMLVTASLLLIACANLAGLLLARGVMRRREIAVRLSIGARRSRVVRQLLTESLLLASLGGVAGLGVSFGAKQLLSRFYATDSEGFHHLYDLSFDWRVLVYSMALVLIMGTLFGLVPARRASRQDLVSELKEGGTELRTKGWLSQVLVVGQVALSMVLVIAAGLLARSGVEVQRGTNFDPDHMIVLRVRPELTKYTQQQVDALVRQMDRRLKETPGVQSVAFMEGGEGLVWNWGDGRDATVSLLGHALTRGESLTVRKQDVGPDFFRTLKIPLLQGRQFEEQDRLGSPRVAIVNQAMAQRLWPDGSAMGRSVFVNAQPFQVIGISADIQPRNAIRAPEPHLYLSYWQSNATRQGDVRLAIRVAEDPAGALPAIRRVVQSLDPNVPIGEDMPMSEQVNLEYMPVLLAQRVMSFCGLLALCLSAVGLYSILAFAVRARTREIGIRMALGARREDVLRLVMMQGTKLAFLGVVTGAIAALISTRLLASLLFGVSRADPVTYLCVTVLVFLVAPAACYFPAHRAMRIDPVRALRTE
ncbi:MAG TPA: ABC transporter permease [Acidobacteriaceae bacterium]